MTPRLVLFAALCVVGCHGKYVRPVSDEPIRRRARAPAARQLSRQQRPVLRRLPHVARARQHADRARAHRRLSWAAATSTTTRAIGDGLGPQHHARRRDRHRQLEGRRDPARAARRRRPGRPLPGAADAVRRLSASVRRRRARGGRVPAHRAGLPAGEAAARRTSSGSCPSCCSGSSACRCTSRSPA